MPNYTPTFHIGDPGPQDLYEYLDTVEARSPSSNDELLDAASELGHNLGTYEKTTAGAVLGRLGVINPGNQFEFTELGDSLVDIMYRDKNVFNNLLHFLYYTAYKRFPEEYLFSSYTYRGFTDYLYNNAPFETLQGHKGTIVSEVGAQAEADDLDMSHTRSGVSISNKSFNNYHQYLESISPSVNPNEEGTAGFKLRSFCPPELFVTIVDYLYQQNDSEYNTLLQVTDETKRQLRQICLLSEPGFGEVLDFADQAYSFFSKKHDFGLNLRLEKELSFNDLQ